MVRQVENQVIKEKCYTNMPKIIYLSKKVQKHLHAKSDLCQTPDYDRGQCAESSYLTFASPDLLSNQQFSLFLLRYSGVHDKQSR